MDPALLAEKVKKKKRSKKRTPQDESSSPSFAVAVDNLEGEFSQE